MRTLLLLLAAFSSLAVAAIGYLAFSGKIALPVYVALMTIITILLIFLCAHLLFNHYFQPPKKR